MIAALAMLWLLVAPRPPAAGTVAVYASSRAGDQLGAPVLSLDGRGLVLRGGSVPAAPDTVKMGEAPVAAGRHLLRVGGRPEREVTVGPGLVTPILLAVQAGQVEAGSVYVGGADYGLGLNELAGRLSALPEFSLRDQSGAALSRRSLAGKEVVVAAFHTTCQETCPLVTGLLLQLRRQAPSALLMEVTTDPLHDDPAALASYRERVGADWTFATGSPEELAAFWSPFGVQLSDGDSHPAVLAMVDSHGFLRATYTGAPELAGGLPAVLRSQLSPAGQALLASGGQGWGAPQVLDQLRTIGGLGPPASRARGPAPDFALGSTEGSRSGLSSFRGRPVLVNFWSAACPPCRTEMPLLQQLANRDPGLVVLLVDVRDAPGPARQFLASIHVTLAALLDEDGQVAASYRVAALPTTVFIRPDGSEEGRWLGALSEEVLASHVSAIEGR